jgi:hypothetical protein
MLHGPSRKPDILEWTRNINKGINRIIRAVISLTSEGVKCREMDRNRRIHRQQCDVISLVFFQNEKSNVKELG